jgi:hypothetical protein
MQSLWLIFFPAKGTGITTYFEVYSLQFTVYSLLLLQRVGKVSQGSVPPPFWIRILKNDGAKIIK